MGLVECKERLESILDSLEKSIDSEKKKKESPEKGIQKFIKTVNEGIKECISKDNLPVHYNPELQDPLTIRVEDYQMERDFFSDNPLTSYIGFPEAYTTLIYRNMCLMYANNIKLNSPRKKYYIDYFEIQDALNTLRLDKNYCMLSMGIEIPDDTQLGIPSGNIHTIRTQYSELLIMPKAECPSLTLLESPVDIEIQSIPDSAMDNIKANIPYLYNQQNFIHYIAIKVIFRDYEGIPSQLKEIGPIQTIL